MIKYLKHREIDKAKWDECMDKSLNGLVYAKSWFLDIVSPDWEGLVENDYKGVMPLPVKRKFLVPYLVQPLFTQQLGVFSLHVTSPQQVIEYLEHIPRKFIRQIFNLNSSNVIQLSRRVTNRYNFELDLNREYPLIYRNYHENTRRNIKKAENVGVLIEVSSNTALFVDLYQKQAKLKFGKHGYEVLKSLVEYSIGNQIGLIVFARDQSGKILAGAFFLKGLARVIYMGSFTTQKGEMASAMFLVINEMIRKNAATPFVFDFEGSMIPGIARFFAGFGAEKKIYQRYKFGL